MNIRDALLLVLNGEHSPEFDFAFLEYAVPILESGRILETAGFIQHGETTCYSHCISVAYYSLKIAERLGVECDGESLVIGGLLHDYFLYDWHCKDPSHRLHGFRHPKTALINAVRDYELNPVEQDIIISHMFPLTLIPPKYKESLIVCLADKICGFAETLRIDLSPLADCPVIWRAGKR